MATYMTSLLLLATSAAYPPPGMSGHVAISIVLCNYISSALAVVERVDREAESRGIAGDLSSEVRMTRQTMFAIMEIPLSERGSHAAFDAALLICMKQLQILWEKSRAIWRQLLFSNIGSPQSQKRSNMLRDFRSQAALIGFLAKRITGDLNVWLPDHHTGAAAKNVNLSRNVIFAGLNGIADANFEDAITSHMKAGDKSYIASYYTATLTLSEMQKQVAAAASDTMVKRVIWRVSFSLLLIYLMCSRKRCASNLMGYFQQSAEEYISRH